MRSMYVASICLDFPPGLSNSLPGCLPVQTVMKPLLYMPPDPPRTASVCLGVKPICPLVQTLMKPLLYIPPDPPRRAMLKTVFA